VLAQGLACVQAKGATLALAQGDDLRVAGAVGFPHSVLDQFLVFPIDAPLPLAQAARTGTAVWLSSEQEKLERFPALAGVRSGVTGTASLPLVAHGLLIGALGIAFGDERVLTTPERRQLLALADLAALALHRIQLGPRQDPGPPPSMDALSSPSRIAEVQRLGLLSLVSAAPMDRLSGVAARLLGARMAQVSILGDEQVVAGSYGFRALRRPTPSRDSLCSLTLALGAPLRIMDAPRHPWVAQLPPVTSGVVRRYLGVPLITDADEIVGALCVFDDSYEPWPVDAEAVLQEVATSVLTEAEYAAQAHRLRAVLERTRRLQVLATELGSAVTLGGVGRALHRVRADVFGARSVHLSALSPDGHLMTRVPPDDDQPVPPGIGFHAASSLPPSDDLLRGLLFPDLPGSSMIRRIEGQIGLVGVAAVVGGPEQEQIWAELEPQVDTLISLALERTRAQETAMRVHRMTGFLARVSASLDSSLDVRRTLDQLTNVLVPAVGDSCVIRLAGPGGGLDPVAFAHADPRLHQLMRGALESLPPSASGLEWSRLVIGEARGRVRYTGAAQGRGTDDENHSAPAASGPQDLHEALDYTSSICVPLRATGTNTVRGTLTVSRAGHRTPFDPVDDLGLLEELARRAATVLANSLLHQQLLASARQLRQALIPSNLPVQEGLQLAARRVAAEPLLDPGGDFYDAWTDGGLWLAVGDVHGGHGEAAAVTGLIRHTLRALTGPMPRSARILERLNGLLAGAATQSGLSTVALARVAPYGRGYQVALASGGHAPAIVVRAGGSVEVLDQGGPLLGSSAAARLTEQDVLLGTDDLLLLYTAGAISSPDEQSRQQPDAGLDRLRAAAASCAGQAARVAVQAMCDAAATGEPEAEDFSVVALRVTS
jgi:GAF domain-containing protein